MRTKLRSIEKDIMAIVYESAEKDMANSACGRLKLNIEKALYLIPGFLENISFIKTLMKCRTSMQVIEKDCSESNRKAVFMEIQSYVGDNLKNARVAEDLT
jgi:hypothetical protein